jgi:ubiquinol-cytochrome c reductase iron-sulfur subunit
MEVGLASHTQDGAKGEVEDHNRRDFLMIAGTAFAAVGGAFALWPMIAQMNPDASTQALATTEVDIGPIKEGQAITVMWRGKPVFIRHRTKAEIEAARAVKLADLKDPYARNSELPDRAPASDVDRVKKNKEQWLVLVGVCTHLGCIPKGQTVVDVKGEYGGWFCPCHGSHYDTSGRIRKGPAPENLPVPRYTFLSDTMIRIG